MACRLVGAKPLSDAGILLIGPLGTNFSEISIEMQTLSFKKMRLKFPVVFFNLPFVCLRVNLAHSQFCKYQNSGLSWHVQIVNWFDHKNKNESKYNFHNIKSMSWLTLCEMGPDTYKLI